MAVKSVKSLAGRPRRQFPSCRAIALELHVSASTVRRDLHATGLVSRSRPKRPCMTDADCKRRKDFASKMLREHTTKELQSIAFSDEKLFDTNDHGHDREWRLRTDQPTPREFEKWAPKVMVWGAIGFNYRALQFFERGVKVDAVVYQEVIKKHLPTIRRRKLMFQQDGARSHTAATTMEVLKASKVALLEGFPARSPDLSPIENMWALVQRKLGDFYDGDLENAVRLAWRSIDTAVVNNLVLSFPRRLKLVKDQNGRFVL